MLASLLGQLFLPTAKQSVSALATRKVPYTAPHPELIVTIVFFYTRMTCAPKRIDMLDVHGHTSMDASQAPKLCVRNAPNKQIHTHTYISAYHLVSFRLVLASGPHVDMEWMNIRTLAAYAHATQMCVY